MKKLFCAFLAMALVILPVGGSMAAYAEDVTVPIVSCSSDTVLASGESGTVTWTLYDDGELNFAPTSGSEGTLASYNGYLTMGWAGYRSKITSVTVTGTVKMGTKAEYLFASCTKLTSVDLSGFDTSEVTDMAYMFEGCSSLKSIDLSAFDTSSVTKMSHMFSTCPKLTDINMTGWDTSNVTTMSAMFYECSKLTTLDLSDFDTSSLKSMSCMFQGCSKLTDINLSGFDTSSVTNLTCMFQECTALKTIDLSSFDTSNVTKMQYMFYKCTSLTTIFASDLWSISSVTNGTDMFYNCKSLAGGNGTAYSSTHVSYTYARIDTDEKPGYFTESQYFVLGEDTNQFAHSGFGSYKTDYIADLVRMNIGHLTEQNEIIQKYSDTWSGSCLGISTSMIYNSEGLLSNVLGGENYYDLGSPLTNDVLLDVINYYYLVQYSYNFDYTAIAYGKGDSFFSGIVNLYTNFQGEGLRLSEFLEEFVAEAKRSKTLQMPFIFGYTEEDGGGHALVVCGYSLNSDGSYRIQIYDPNSYSTGVRYFYMTVDSDYSSFSFADANMEYLGTALEDTWLSLRYIGIDELADAEWDILTDGNTASVSTEAVNVTAENAAVNTNAAADTSADIAANMTAAVTAMEASETTTLSFSAYKKFTLTNASGETLTYDGEGFSGDMTVYSAKETGEDSPIFYMTVGASDSFVLTGFSGTFTITTETDGTYYTATAKGAKTITLDADNGITFTGSSYTFTGGTNAGTDNSDLVCISGKATDDCTISATDDRVTLNTDGSCTDVTVASYQEADCDSTSISAAVKKITVSDNASGNVTVKTVQADRKAQKITVKKASLKKTIKVKKLKKKNQTFKLKASTSGNGKITYKKVKGNKKIKVSKAGKVTVKKGLKKGKTYKVKVKITAAKTSTYKKATKTVTLKIKIK